MAISSGNVMNIETTKIPEIVVKCKTCDNVLVTLFSLATALSPAMAGIKSDERDVRMEDGKNKRGKTIPLIIPYRLIAVSEDSPYNKSLAGIIVFSTVLKIEFKLDVAEIGSATPNILKVIFFDFCFGFFEYGFLSKM